MPDPLSPAVTCHPVSKQRVEQGCQWGAAAEHHEQPKQQQQDRQREKPPFLLLSQEQKELFQDVPHGLGGLSRGSTVGELNGAGTLHIPFFIGKAPVHCSSQTSLPPCMCLLLAARLGTSDLVVAVPRPRDEGADLGGICLRASTASPRWRPFLTDCERIAPPREPPSATGHVAISRKGVDRHVIHRDRVRRLTAAATWHAPELVLVLIIALEMSGSLSMCAAKRVWRWELAMTGKTAHLLRNIAKPKQPRPRGAHRGEPCSCRGRKRGWTAYRLPPSHLECSMHGESLGHRGPRASVSPLNGGNQASVVVHFQDTFPC